MELYNVALDAGTSGLKAGLISLSGNVKDSLYWPVVTEKNSNNITQNINNLLGKSFSIINELICKNKLVSEQVIGLAVDGQMGGVIGIDDNYNSITGLDLGLDLKAEQINKRFHDEFKNEILSISCGSPRNAPKIRWWKEEFPEVYKSIKKFVTLNSFIAGQITGLKAEDAFIDYTLLAYFGNESAGTLTWSTELSSLEGIDIEKLPLICCPWDKIGTVTDSISKLTGLASGTPVYAGAGDQPAGFIGRGVWDYETLTDISGSTTMLAVNTEKFKPDMQNQAVKYLPSVLPGMYNAYTYINGGGLSLIWLKDLLKIADLETLQNKAKNIPCGCGGLLFIPYFCGRQSPFNPDFRGGWMGLNLTHDEGALYRSILEAIGYDYRYGKTCIEQLMGNIDFKKVIVSGGGAKSGLWNEIKADILGLPLVVPDDINSPLKGSGIIASIGAGFYTTDEVKNLTCCREKTRYLPDVERGKEYNDYYKRYNSFIKMLSRNIF